MTNEAVSGLALDEASEQLVVMKLANEFYGVDIGAVNTIIRMQEVTAIPRTPDFVEGVINLRGSIIPIVDLRKRFGLPVGEITKASRIVVVEANGQIIGMIVDAVVETLRLPLNAIEPPSPVVSTVDTAYVRGVGKLDGRLIILLDLSKLLTSSEFEALAAM
ncbi:MAG: chemotaxis protein CheW [Armatimonadota bacterium]